jgi:hypothetical protein
VRRLLQQAGTTAIHPRLQQRLEDAKPMSVGDFTALLEEVDRCRSVMLTCLQSYDLILCPVCACPAPPHGTTLSIPGYTGVYNLTGWPGAVVRGGTSRRDCRLACRSWRGPGVRMWPSPWRNTWRRRWEAGSGHRSEGGLRVVKKTDILAALALYSSRRATGAPAARGVPLIARPVRRQ